LIARLDLEAIVAAGPRRIDPPADGIAHERGRDIGRPVATVGVDPAQVVHESELEIGHLRRDDDLHRLVQDHGPRHAGREATELRIVGLRAGGEALQVGLEDGLILRGERSLLSASHRLAGIELRSVAAIGPQPLAAPIRIFERAGRSHHQRRRNEGDGGDQVCPAHAGSSPANHSALMPAALMIGHHFSASAR
jgi:hypothetical protein